MKRRNYNIKGILVIPNSVTKEEDNNNNLYNYLSIYLDNNKTLLYNLNTGKEYPISNDIEMKLTNCFIKIYSDDNNDFQDQNGFSNIKNITLYRNIYLKNNNTDLNIEYSNFIVLEDINNNKIFIDYLNNRIYYRYNMYSIGISKFTKNFIMYENSKENNFNIKELNKCFIPLIHNFILELN